MHQEEIDQVAVFEPTTSASTVYSSPVSYR
jgi:hypothetical protein